MDQSYDDLIAQLLEIIAQRRGRTSPGRGPLLNPPTVTPSATPNMTPVATPSLMSDAAGMSNTAPAYTTPFSPLSRMSSGNTDSRRSAPKSDFFDRHREKMKLIRNAESLGIKGIPTSGSRAEAMGFLPVDKISQLGGNTTADKSGAIGYAYVGGGTPDPRSYSIINIGGKRYAMEVPRAMANGGSVSLDDLNRMTMEDIIAMLDQMGYVPDGY